MKFFGFQSIELKLLALLPLLSSCKTNETFSEIKLEESIRKVEAELKRSDEERREQKSTEETSYSLRKEASYGGGFGVAAMPLDIPNHPWSTRSFSQPYFSDSDNEERLQRKRDAQALRKHKRNLEDEKYNYISRSYSNPIKLLGLARDVAGEYLDDESSLDRYRESVFEKDYNDREARSFPIIGPVYEKAEYITKMLEENFDWLTDLINLPTPDNTNFRANRKGARGEFEFDIGINKTLILGVVHNMFADREARYYFRFSRRFDSFQRKVKKCVSTDAPFQL